MKYLGPIARIGIPFGAILILISPSLMAQSVTYDYDAAGRLETAVYDGMIEVAYDYDAGGNLLKKSSCPLPENYGAGTPGSGGIVPRIFSSGGAPRIGNTSFRIEGDQILGGANVLLIVGFAKAQIPVLGIVVLVDLNLPTFSFSFPASGPAGVAGAGAVSIPASIPDNPNFVGIEIDAQLIVSDPGGPRGLAASDGLSLTLCGN